MKKILIASVLFLFVIGLTGVLFQNDYEIINANKTDSGTEKTILPAKGIVQKVSKIEIANKKATNRIANATLECLSLKDVNTVDHLYQEVIKNSKLDIIKYKNFRLTNDKGERFVFTETTEFNENSKKVKKLSLYLIDENGIPELVKTPFKTNYITEEELNEFLSSYKILEKVVGKGLSTPNSEIDVELKNGNVSNLRVHKDGKFLNCNSSKECKCEG